MAAVHIGIGHADDAVVAKFGFVILGVDSAAECGYHGFDFFVFQNSVKRCLFNVQNLAAKGKYRLETSVSTLLCTAACRVSFDEIYFAVSRVFVGAVRKFAGKSRAFECALSSCAFSCHTRRFSRSLRRDGF